VLMRSVGVGPSDDDPGSRGTYLQSFSDMALPLVFIILCPFALHRWGLLWLSEVYQMETQEGRGAPIR